MIPSIVEEFQCSGCSKGGDCYKPKSDLNIACDKHSPGTFVMGQGKILLGFPKGFNRLGVCETIAINIFKTYDDMKKEWNLDMFNVPIWKHLDSNGNTIIKGISPRILYPFIHIVVEDCLDKVNCLEISQNNINSMD